MSYIVLARKYRPKTFSEILGQSHVTKTLENAFHQNKVAQAYLFTGTRGIGKTSLARILAKALRCEDPNCQEGQKSYGQPCNTCPSCQEIGESNSLDVLEIDGASNNGVDNIRELRENIRFSPTRGSKKVYIVDEVHMLTGAAFNALLKTLEEPPEHATFIFATTEIQKIPATILSRCQRFDLKRVSKDRISRHLHNILAKENIKAEPTVIELIARKAEGSFRDALSILDQVIALCGNTLNNEDASDALGVINLDLVLSMWKYCFTQQPIRALEKLQQAHHFGVSMKALAVSLAELTRDALWIKLGGEKDSLELLTEKESLEEVIKDIPVGTLQAGFRILSQSITQIIHSTIPKAQLEFSLTQLSQIGSMDSIASLLERLDTLEKTSPGRTEGRKVPVPPTPMHTSPSSHTGAMRTPPPTPPLSTSAPTPATSSFQEEQTGAMNWKRFVSHATKKYPSIGSALEHTISITPVENWKSKDTKHIRIGVHESSSIFYKHLKDKASNIQELLHEFIGEKKELTLELIKDTNIKPSAPMETLDKQDRRVEKQRKEKVLEKFKKNEVVMHTKKMFNSDWSAISIVENKEEE